MSLNTIVLRRAGSLVLVAGLLASVSAHSEIVGMVVDSTSNKVMVRFNTSTGVASDIGFGVSMGSFSAGGNALSSGNLVRYSANATGETARRVYSLNPATGGSASSPLFSVPAGWSTTPYFLVETPTGTRGVFRQNDTTKWVGAVDTSTGAVSALGSGLAIKEMPSGLAGYNPSAGLIYFIALDSVDTWRLYVVRESDGALLGSVPVSSPAGVGLVPLFLAVDPSTSKLYGILPATSSATTRYLVTYSTATGAATTVGSFTSGAATLGVSTIDPVAKTFVFAGFAPGETSARLYQISLTTGAVAANPLITGAHGTTPMFLQYWSGSGSAGRVPNGDDAPGTMLQVVKSGGNLQLTWGASCSATVLDYTLQRGTMGSWYSHQAILCTTGGATTTTTAVPGSDSYYLVVPITASVEGSYGTNSTGAQRPTGSVICMASQESPSCP